MKSARCAVVACIVRDDGKMLVVWNKRYGRWGMPGGKVEEGEELLDALKREVREETGVDAIGFCLAYEGHHGESVESTRGSYVYLYTVQIYGVPREVEPGCPVTWFTREEFLKWGLAPDFYRRAFAIGQTMQEVRDGK